MIQVDTFSAYTQTVDNTVSTLSADSLFIPTQAHDTVAPAIRKSLFVHHSLPVTNTNEVTIHHQDSSGWMFGLIAITLFIQCFYIKANRLRFWEICKSLFNHHTQERVLREANLYRPERLSVMALMMLVPLSLLCYHILCRLEFANYGWWGMIQWGGIFLAMITAYYTRNGIIRILGNGFYNYEAADAFICSNYLYQLVEGIITTPLLFFICFTGNTGTGFLYILLTLLSILFILRLFRGSQLFLTTAKRPRLYFFYYLCTLEIVPFAILAKAIISL